MNGISPLPRPLGVPRGTSLCRLALVVLLAMAGVLGNPPVGRAAALPLVSWVSVGSRAHDIVIDSIPGVTGTFAFVATDRGLTILDISNPQAPEVRGSALSVNCAVNCERGPVAKSQGLAKKGKYVFLADGVYGMQVIDVSDPWSPQTIMNAIAGGTPLYRPPGATSLAPQRGKIYHIAVHPTADAAYAVSYNGELYVWDISPLYEVPPAAPVLTQTLGVMLWGGGVCTTCVDRMLNEAENGTAYVTGVTAVGSGSNGRVLAVDWGYGGFYVWDSTDPWKLEFLGTHRLKVSMYRVAVDLAHRVNGQQPGVVYTLGAFWINSGLITTPLSPVIAEGGATYCSTLGGQPTPAPASTAPNCGVTETCFPCGHARMTTPTGSALVGDGGGLGFSSNHRYAFYVGGRGNGELAIIDVTDPDNLVKVASIAPGPMTSAARRGGGDRRPQRLSLRGGRSSRCARLLVPGTGELGPLIESAPLEVRERPVLAAAKPWARSRRARIGLVLLAVALTLVGVEAVLAALPAGGHAGHSPHARDLLHSARPVAAPDGGRPLSRVQAPARRRGELPVRGRHHPDPDDQPWPRPHRIPRHRNAGALRRHRHR